MNKNVRTMLIFVGVIIVALGVLIINGIAKDQRVASEKVAPQPTITVTATPSASTTETVPQSCLDALDEADATMKKSGDVFMTMSEIFKAIDAGDYVKLNKLAQKFEKQSQGFDLDDYIEMRNSCRNAA